MLGLRWPKADVAAERTTNLLDFTAAAAEDDRIIIQTAPCLNSVLLLGS